MKRRALSVFSKPVLLISFLACHLGAEPAIINDPDGFTNVRKGTNGKAQIVAKIHDEEIFDCLSDSEEIWQRIVMKDGTTGYVHRSRIRRHCTAAKNRWPGKGLE